MTSASETRGVILVWDQDATSGGRIADWLSSAGYAVHLRDAPSLPDRGEMPSPWVVCVNLELERHATADLVSELKHRDVLSSVVVYGEAAHASRAAQLVRAGAFDFVSDPVSREPLLLVVERAIVHRALVIQIQGLHVALRQERALINLRELEKRAIERALEQTSGNLSEAARLLGIGRATIYRKLAAYHIHAPS